jgi:hypothetical protein
MKKLIYSALIVTLTFITILAMNTYNREQAKQTTNNTVEIEEQVEIAPGEAGYIFDDFGKGINIPIEYDEAE